MFLHTRQLHSLCWWFSVLLHTPIARNARFIKLDVLFDDLALVLQAYDLIYGEAVPLAALNNDAEVLLLLLMQRIRLTSQDPLLYVHNEVHPLAQ